MNAFSVAVSVAMAVAVSVSHSIAYFSHNCAHFHMNTLEFVFDKDDTHTFILRNDFDKFIECIG